MSRPKIPWEPVRDAYEKGAAPRALAQQYGVSRSSVYRHIRSEGWTVAPDKKDRDDSSAAPRKRNAPLRAPAGNESPETSVFPQLHQAARRLRQTAAVLLTAAENGDEVSIRDMKELAALLRELTTLTTALDESGPSLIRVVLEPPLDTWAM